ncbi:MAG: hypothetical protein ACTSWY_08360 [Promethearchaeota archaeon]
MQNPLILEEKYRFIQDDVFLCPRVYVKTGRQQLILQKIDSETGEIEFEDFIDCIHTAIGDISIEDLNGIQVNPVETDAFYKKTLNIRSTEDLYILNLRPEDKFMAMKSWAAGIAEAGKDAFRLETDIEIAGHLYYPIAGKLLLFMVRVDSDFIFDYVRMVEKQCIFEGEKHLPSLMANVMPILDLLYHDFARPVIKDRVKVIRAMHSIVEFPLESVSSGAGGIIRYYIRDHPEYGVRYITHVIERDYDRGYKNNREIFFKLIAPLLIVFLHERYKYLNNRSDADVEFIKLILSFHFPEQWFRKIKVLPLLNAIQKKFNL